MKAIESSIEDMKFDLRFEEGVIVEARKDLEFPSFGGYPTVVPKGTRGIVMKAESYPSRRWHLRVAWEIGERGTVTFDTNECELVVLK